MAPPQGQPGHSLIDRQCFQDRLTPGTEQTFHSWFFFIDYMRNYNRQVTVRYR